MKKYLATLCAAMLCVCCLALAACGGGASGSAASGSAAASSSAAANPVDQYIGDWKLAAAETEGVTMAGDFSMIFGTDQAITLTVNADGTGKMFFNGENADVTWKETADGIAITADKQTVDATMKDGALALAMNQDSFSGTMYFTKDGTYAGAPAIDPTKAQPVTSKDALEGTWSLSAMNMMGISMYGDPSALSAVAGDTDTTLVFNADGTASVLGGAGTWAVADGGATVTLSGVEMPITMLDGSIMFDMTEQTGMQLIMLFSK